MAKKGTSVFRNPVDQSATKVSTLPDLTAYQAKWGGEGRPSPRTGTTGAGITKFGTQQLKYVDNDPSKGVVEIDTGANFRLGLQQTVASAGIDFGKATPFSQTYQQKRLGTITTYDQLATSPHAPQPPSGNPLDPTTWFTPKDKIPTQTQNNGQCVDDPMCGMKEFFEGVPAGTYCKCPNWFGWGNGNGNGKERGCTECESCPPEKLAIGTCDCGIHCGIDDETGKPKPPEPCPECPPSHVSLGTGSFLDPCRCVPPEDNPCTTECTTCDSDKCHECDAWDVPCETCRKKNGTCTTPADECGCEFLDFGCKFQCWWDKYGMIVMIVGGLIGLGIVLWLLRPLFGIVKNVSGGRK